MYINMLALVYIVDFRLSGEGGGQRGGGGRSEGWSVPLSPFKGNAVIINLSLQ